MQYFRTKVSERRSNIIIIAQWTDFQIAQKCIVCVDVFLEVIQFFSSKFDVWFSFGTCFFIFVTNQWQQESTKTATNLLKTIDTKLSILFLCSSKVQGHYIFFIVWFLRLVCSLLLLLCTFIVCIQSIHWCLQHNHL